MTVSTGYTSLHESAARLDLSSRGRLRVTGSDRVRLLHAMLTNDVRSLSPGQGNYNFLLDAQGHILADAWLYLLRNSILLDLEPDASARALDHLNRHIIADDVEVTDVTSSLAAIALEGPGAERISGVDLSTHPGSTIEIDNRIVARVSATGQPGFRFFVDAARKAEVLEELERAGAKPATPEDTRIVRVENGVPRYGEDFDATSLAQETQQLHAVSFQKGCYLGQEIVERIRARGQVHKLLVRVAVDGKEPPPEGTPIRADGHEIGKLTSPVYSPLRGQCLGFSILRREFASPGTGVTVDAQSGQVLG